MVRLNPEHHSPEKGRNIEKNDAAAETGQTDRPPSRVGSGLLPLPGPRIPATLTPSPQLYRRREPMVLPEPRIQPDAAGSPLPNAHRAPGTTPTPSSAASVSPSDQPDWIRYRSGRRASPVSPHNHPGFARASRQAPIPLPVSVSPPDQPDWIRFRQGRRTPPSPVDPQNHPRRPSNPQALPVWLRSQLNQPLSSDTISLEGLNTTPPTLPTLNSPFAPSKPPPVLPRPRTPQNQGTEPVKPPSPAGENRSGLTAESSFDRFMSKMRQPSENRSISEPSKNEDFQESRARMDREVSGGDRKAVPAEATQSSVREHLRPLGSGSLFDPLERASQAHMPTFMTRFPYQQDTIPNQFQATLGNPSARQDDRPELQRKGFEDEQRYRQSKVGVAQSRIKNASSSVHPERRRKEVEFKRPEEGQRKRDTDLDRQYEEDIASIAQRQRPIATPKSVIGGAGNNDGKQKKHIEKLQQCLEIHHILLTRVNALPVPADELHKYLSDCEKQIHYLLRNAPGSAFRAVVGGEDRDSMREVCIDVLEMVTKEVLAMEEDGKAKGEEIGGEGT